MVGPASTKGGPLHEDTFNGASCRIDARSERHRHDLLPARRPERCVLRCPLRPHQCHPADPRPPRAGLRLHGAGLCHGDRQTFRLCRGARSRLPQHHGRAFDRLCRQRAGAGADRPDPAGDDRAQCRLAARTAGPTRHHARPHQVGRPHPLARRGSGTGQRGLPPSAFRPPAPGGARMRTGYLGTPRAGRVDEHAGSRPIPARSTRKPSNAPPSCWAVPSGR